MDERYYDNPTLLISQVFERKKEIQQMPAFAKGEDQGKPGADPFFLIQEALEMSKQMNHSGPSRVQSTEATSGGEMRQEYNKETYNRMIDSQFDSKFSDDDPLGLKEKMKKFRFAKVDQEADNKDSNWFSKFQTQQKSDSLGKSGEKAKMKFGLSEEDERKIQKEMIPGFIAKQQELKPQYDHFRKLGKQLENLRQDYNIKKLKQVKPANVTSFMTVKGSMAKQYEQKQDQIKGKSLQADRVQVGSLTQKLFRGKRYSSMHQKSENEFLPSDNPGPQLDEVQSRNSGGALPSRGGSRGMSYSRNQGPFASGLPGRLSSQGLDIKEIGGDTRVTQESKMSKGVVSDDEDPETKQMRKEFERLEFENRYMLNIKEEKKESVQDYSHNPMSTKGVSSMASTKPTKRPCVVNDEGKEFAMNEYGLIDREQTEELFLKKQEEQLEEILQPGPPPLPDSSKRLASTALPNLRHGKRNSREMQPPKRQPERAERQTALVPARGNCQSVKGNFQKHMASFGTSGGGACFKSKWNEPSRYKDSKKMKPLAPRGEHVKLGKTQRLIPSITKSRNGNSLRTQQSSLGPTSLNGQLKKPDQAEKSEILTREYQLMSNNLLSSSMNNNGQFGLKTGLPFDSDYYYPPKERPDSKRYDRSSIKSTKSGRDTNPRTSIAELKKVYNKIPPKPISRCSSKQSHASRSRIAPSVDDPQRISMRDLPRDESTFGKSPLRDLQIDEFSLGQAQPDIQLARPPASKKAKDFASKENKGVEEVKLTTKADQQKPIKVVPPKAEAKLMNRPLNLLGKKMEKADKGARPPRAAENEKALDKAAEKENRVSFPEIKPPPSRDTSLQPMKGARTPKEGPCSPVEPLSGRESRRMNAHAPPVDNTRSEFQRQIQQEIKDKQKKLESLTMTGGTASLEKPDEESEFMKNNALLLLKLEKRNLKRKVKEKKIRKNIDQGNLADVGVLNSTKNELVTVKSTQARNPKVHKATKNLSKLIFTSKEHNLRNSNIFKATQPFDPKVPTNSGLFITNQDRCLFEAYQNSKVSENLRHFSSNPSSQQFIPVILSNQNQASMNSTNKKQPIRTQPSGTAKPMPKSTKNSEVAARSKEQFRQQVFQIDQQRQAIMRSPTSLKSGGVLETTQFKKEGASKVKVMADDCITGDQPTEAQRAQSISRTAGGEPAQKSLGMNVLKIKQAEGSRDPNSLEKSKTPDRELSSSAITAERRSSRSRKKTGKRRSSRKRGLSAKRDLSAKGMTTATIEEVPNLKSPFMINYQRQQTEVLSDQQNGTLPERELGLVREGASVEKDQDTVRQGFTTPRLLASRSPTSHRKSSVRRREKQRSVHRKAEKPEVKRNKIKSDIVHGGIMIPQNSKSISLSSSNRYQGFSLQYTSGRPILPRKEALPVTARTNEAAHRYQSDALKKKKKLKKNIKGLSGSRPIDYQQVMLSQRSGEDMDNVQMIKYALMNLDTDSLRQINSIESSTEKIMSPAPLGSIERDSHRW